MIPQMLSHYLENLGPSCGSSFYSLLLTTHLGITTRERACSVVLDLCVSLISSKRCERVLWVRSETNQGTVALEMLSRDSAGDDLRDIDVKYVKSLGELRAFLANFHLVRSQWDGLVLDDVNFFCSHDVSKYMEVVALALNALDGSEERKKFFVCSLAMQPKESSTAKLANYFHSRIDVDLNSKPQTIRKAVLRANSLIKEGLPMSVKPSEGSLAINLLEKDDPLVAESFDDEEDKRIRRVYPGGQVKYMRVDS